MKTEAWGIEGLARCHGGGGWETGARRLVSAFQTCPRRALSHGSKDNVDLRTCLFCIL